MIAKVLALALESAGIGEFEKNIFVGRMPADDIGEDGFWCVTQLPGGAPTGGNISTWKTQTLFQVRAVFNGEDGDKLYDLDHQVRGVLTALPYTDIRFARVVVEPMGDDDLAEAEQRAGTWNVTTITINKNSTEDS